jgi:hypothetical protein
MTPPPIRRGLAAVFSVALVAVSSLAGAPVAAAQGSLDVVANGVADGRARLIVGTDDGPPGPPSVSVWVAGVAQPTRVDALLSERLAMALVIDTSTDAAAVLPAGATGAANLVLAAPPAARGTLVVDSAPPVVAAPWPSEREAMLAGLSAVQPGGTRATAAALDLALAQLPAVSTDPRIVVLFTASPDAGGESAAAVVDRMRAAGAVLAVVETGGAGSADFWSTTAAGTGGVAVRAASTDVVAAFDRVTRALQQRCLVTIPAPERLPAQVVVQTGGGGAPLTAEAVVPAPPPVVGGPALLVVLAVVAVLVVAALRRRARAPVGRTIPIWNIPPRPAPFVERKTLSAQVTEALRGNRPVWLHAAGAAAGVGTTTAAIDFAHRHRARYDIVWWVPALDPDLVPDYLAELAEQAGLAGSDDSADRAAASLTEALRHRPRWLLVFDDAGSPRELASYLPDGPGDVLVTSGDPGWRDVARSLPVPVLTGAEAVALLRSGRRDLPAAEAECVARACGHLPVAVGPAAAWLADTGTNAHTVLPDPTTGAADAMWNLLLDRLHAEHPKAFALLALVAWMGQAPVSLTVVTGHPDVLPAPLDGSVAEQAELLHRRGMAQLTEAGVLLHGTPAELVRCRTQADHRRCGGWPAVVVRLLRAAAPHGSPSDPATRAAWRRVLPHVVAATDPSRSLDVVVDDVGWLLDQAGRYLAACGRTRAAQALLDDAQVLDASRSGEA